MEQAYPAAFLLPSLVVKRLTNLGWQFESSERLSESVIIALEMAFGLRPSNSYPDMDVFDGAGIKVTVVRDSIGQIENMAVQLRAMAPKHLRAELDSAGFGYVEVFVPAA